MIQRVGVVGAGTMGLGIAQLCAQSGFSVKVQDAVPAALQAAPGRLKQALDAAVLKGKLTTIQAERAYHSIEFTDKTASLAGADLVIEAASENFALKREIFKGLSEACPEAILSSNTSSLSIAALAQEVQNPARVLGIHFFNPPVVMKLVEMVRAPSTSPEVFQAAWDFVLTGLRKMPVDVKDTPGFIVNRVMRPYYLKAQELALAGAGIAPVDEACRTLGGLPMGPFELMDLIGLDVNLSITAVIYESLGRPERLKPQPVQERLVSLGHLGRKAGRGFYLYKDGQKGGVNPEAEASLPPAGRVAAAAAWRALQEALIGEAEKAHAEGVAGKADIDTAVKLAMNFPKGPFEWAKAAARS